MDKTVYPVPDSNIIPSYECSRHHGEACPRLADGGFPTRKVPANVLDKQSRTADKGCSSSLRIEREANNSSP
jgi:hypothetical protein